MAVGVLILVITACGTESADGRAGAAATVTVTAGDTTEVPASMAAVAIDAGENQTCALIEDGTARCWGGNAVGQLGTGTATETPVTEPSAVTGLTGANAIATGFNHTCALIEDGTARCWGSNSWGQLSNTTMNADFSAPETVTGITGATAIATGLDQTCALIEDGTARCLGNNIFGQLGNGTATGSPVTEPVTVTGLSGATAIATGDTHTCALINDGTARCWGNNTFGKLGTGTTETQVAEPAPVTGLTGATAIATGFGHTCALVEDGTARCWGGNTGGQLGTGTTETQVAEPAPVTGLTGATAITTGANHTCALIKDGTARCWGNNTHGQLGTGTTSETPVTEPAPVTGLTGATAITTGANHTCALINDGTARCWGNNDTGQLGTDGDGDATVPEQVLGIR